MEIGLIGKPSSGKSSFFKAATMIDIPIDSRPFTTIKPNVGIAYVTAGCVDKEFGIKCKPKQGKCENGKRYIPVKLWDIAGLVPDAHLGKGLGLKFLDDIRQASILIHIVDCSGKTDEEGRPTEFHDPVKDVEFVEKEINEWFSDIIKRAIEKYKIKIRTEKIDIASLLFNQLSGLGIKKEHIDACMNYFNFDYIDEFASKLRERSKPIIIAANKIDVESAEKNLDRLEKAFPHYKIIPVSAASEIALNSAKERGLIDYDGENIKIKKTLTENQIKGLNLIQENVLNKYKTTGIQKCLNLAIFNVLKKIVVYPVANVSKLSDNKGNVLPDAFLVDSDIELKEFAYMLHTDIGDNFIGGIDARNNKKLGANYKLKNNDVFEILFRR
ncbi:MAG: YchF-related putative GTPase [Candidatus Aenigmatarchaeota archaeon]